MTWLRYCAAALLLLTMSCSSGLSGLSAIEPAQPAPYRLGPGDEIRITVLGFDALTNDYIVSDAGTISMPMLSVMNVQGKTTADLEHAVMAQLEGRELAVKPSVSAQVQKYRPFFILGEVQRPGQYPYVPGMSVLTAVSIAGGYTFRAETQYAAITRQNGEKIIKGRARQQTPVLPGDTIYVYEDWF